MDGVSGTYGVEGRLHIQVRTNAETVTDVRLRSDRALNAGELLQGRPLQQALDLLPALFSLCGAAQTACGLSAVENALGLSLSAPQDAARRLLVAAEALEQTLWRINLDWPKSLDMQPDLAGIRDLRRLFRRLRTQMFADTSWNRIGGAPMAPDPRYLVETVDAAAQRTAEILFPDTRRSPRDADGLARWIDTRRGCAAALAHYLRSRGLTDFGHSSVAPLPRSVDGGFLAQQLSADDDWSFCARPHYLGGIYETGALSHQADDPLVNAMQAKHGKGLLTRLIARLADIDDLIERMRGCVDALGNDAGIEADAGASGLGLGTVETARGLLAHWVEFDNGEVTRYRILAPTEWNFHPEGAFVQGLVGTDASADTPLRQRIDLLVNALDPCVQYQLLVGDQDA